MTGTVDQDKFPSNGNEYRLNANQTIQEGQGLNIDKINDMKYKTAGNAMNEGD